MEGSPDYEAEFAFAIGKCGKNISADRWQNTFTHSNVTSH
jgi:2-keto-4-pentenoate hydratase/2-oxohepta-3-ene-1,7-dioic acid hydratase in catechol pathway